MSGSLRAVTIGCLLFLAACAGAGGVRDLGFWGLGWQFTAVQNRFQPAIPPVLRFLRERYPEVRPADIPDDLGREFRSAVLGAPGELQDRLDRRLIGAFAVTGLPCAAEGYPVQEGDWAVGAFVVVDVTALSKPPRDWTPCPPVPPGEIGDRVPALRALIASLVDVSAPKRISAAY